jgi:hypothetical protein
VHRSDRARPVTDCSSDALHRRRPDIAGREHARARRLERQRLEALREQSVEVGVREDESLVVEFDEAVEPPIRYDDIDDMRSSPRITIVTVEPCCARKIAA